MRYAVPVDGPEPAKAVGYLAAAGIQTVTADYIEVEAIVTAENREQAEERVRGVLPSDHRAGSQAIERSTAEDRAASRGNRRVPGGH